MQKKLDRQGLLSIRDKIKKVFFYRICGTGMGASAVLLKERGLEVAGGDVNFYPPMSDYLKETGIPMHELSKITDEELKTYDLIVVGNVVPNGSADAKRIENSGVPYCSFPAALGAMVLKDINVIGIAGTHGKTTTTYLMTQIFEKLGEDPGYFIGGVITGRPSSRLGNGKYFFIESDEYDSAYFEKISKFRSYEIDTLVLTSLEFDHADIFENLEQIEGQFKSALPEITKYFILCSDYESTNKMFAEKYKERAYWYGSNCANGPKIIHQSPGKTKFLLVVNGKEEVFETNLVGLHNILNLSACVIYAALEGFKLTEIKDAILNLEMVKRRQEKRGMFGKLTVIDDFAHHPKAVDLTIDSIKISYPNQKIYTVFDPVSATARSSIYEKDFTKALSKSDLLILCKPSRATSVKWAQDLNLEKIKQDCEKNGIETTIMGELPQLLEKIEKLKNENAVLLVLSNGTCLDLWKSDFVKKLEK